MPLLKLLSRETFQNATIDFQLVKKRLSFSAFKFWAPPMATNSKSKYSRKACMCSACRKSKGRKVLAKRSVKRLRRREGKEVIKAETKEG